MDFDMHRSETKMQHFKLSDPNDFVAHNWCCGIYLLVFKTKSDA